MIKLDANFSNLAKISKLFRFYLVFCFYALKKYVDFSHKLEIPRIKSHFRHKSGKLVIQIKDYYYINWKTAQIGKILIIFPKIWTGKAIDNLPSAK